MRAHILGGGSNTLFLDAGFEGLVVRPSLLGVSWSGSEALVEGARDEVLRAIGEFGADARTDTAEMQTEIRRVVRRFFNKRIERKPMIVPVLLEL